MKQALRTLSLLAGTLMVALPASASVTGNIGATSNYLWRGATQTGDAPAVQGGIDFEHDSGLYLGTWASNVDFGDDTSYEIDFYGGYAGSIGEDFGYDISYLYYAYPDSDSSIDFGEVTLALSWKWFSIGYSKVVNAGSDVASDPFDEKDLSYINAGVSFPLSETLSISAHYGYSSGDVVNAWFDTDNYADYSLSLDKETDFGTISFLVSDTDLEGDDPKVVVGYSYSFDL
ncbi:TorF family putative porin [Shewanella rhizosphaerae]|uniref:TorF family putative porin n=1 Tax=Shewanella TaxID=22 RepID=UPI001C659592|nr:MULTISPECIES: TorF family putative porin [Shewanella]QYJ82855.1 TorF family putative porin [Shewanella aegiceratis]QYJ98083.1 TorF family putative porin [Shewanella alkalitolerans]QYK13351.1 TorF family putative porin [Shewanella rhizosphaerae]